MMMCERNICLIVAYDGTAYHGFQRQANGVSVQQVLEERLESLFGHPLTIHGASRTDAGVHAYGQAVSFKTAGRIPVSRIAFAAQGVLPPDIIVRKAVVMPADFHARISAIGKTYHYRIYNHPLPDPFLRRYAWHIRRKLDVGNMCRALQHVMGKHDFSAFRASGGRPVNPVREILHAECRQDGDQVICLFHGTGFLYHMVRNLVGTLADIGTHKLEPHDMLRIRESRNRHLAGATAPANGLYLQEVHYDSSRFSFFT